MKQPGDDTEAGGFPGPIATEKGHHFALPHLEGEAEEGLEIAVKRHFSALFIRVIFAPETTAPVESFTTPERLPFAAAQSTPEVHNRAAHTTRTQNLLADSVAM